MSRNYKFHNPDGLYFVSFAVINWLEVFTRDEYKDIVLDSIRFYQRENGLEIIAWCIMNNHVHLIFRVIGISKPEVILGGMKQFTSKAIVKAVQENLGDNRKEFLLSEFQKAAQQSSNVANFQFWQHDNMPIDLWSNKVIKEKITYIHQNPVKAGYVLRAEEYKYSSASDYAGENGVLEGVIIADLK